MPKEFRAFFDVIWKKNSSTGKITVASLVICSLVGVTTLGAYIVHASDSVSTSVTVLNVPPVWTRNAHETTGSATSTPTNAGQTLRFQAIATDSNGDAYYLLICSNSNAPTAHSGSAPTCGSGALQWAVSTTSRPSGTTATAATTTTDNFPFLNESNDWYAWVCDASASNPSCYSSYTNSDPTDSNYPDSNSPFVINHSPYFFTITNNGNQDPGGTETWTAVATDTDVIRGTDQLTLKVCKASGLVNTGYCSSTGTWATSTAIVTGNTISTSSPIKIPTQDKTYDAYVYVMDQNLLVARAGTTSVQGSNSSFVVNNVRPTVDGSTLSVSTTTNIILIKPNATSGPYRVEFVVTDNNGCQNATAGNEISLATSTVYRSGVGLNSCKASSDFNTNSCYPSVNPMSLMSCTQDTSGAVTGNSCSGASDSTVGWYCNYYLYSNADATDATSFFSSENWLASVQATDDNGLLSAATTSLNGAEVLQFLAYSVSTTSVAYGGLQPGQNTSPFVQTTDLHAWGNVGLDESLYGDTMCIGWVSQGFCDTHNSTNSILPNFQQMATSSLNYNDTYAFTLGGTTTPYMLHIGVLKTIATTSVQTKDTFWGIQIPGTITVSGAYTGQNTIIGVTASTSRWY